MIDVRPFVSTFRTCHSVLYCERIGKVGWGVHERDLYMVNQKLRDDLTDQLCRAILSLDTMEECYQFFEDICTVGELRAMGSGLMLPVCCMQEIPMTILLHALEPVPRPSAVSNDA